MAIQPTKQDFERGVHHATRQEIQKSGRRRGNSPIRRNAPHGLTPDEQFAFVLNELDALWSNLRGGGDAKSTQYPTLRLSQALDQKGRPYQLYNDRDGVWEDGTNLTDARANIARLEGTIWVPATTMKSNPAISTPAADYYGGGAARVMGVEIPYDASANIFLYGSIGYHPNWLETPAFIESTDLYYGLKDAPITGSMFRYTSSGFGYDSGDDLTAPLTEWNEAESVDISGATADYIYKTTLPEASANLQAVDYVGIRLAMNRTHADWTYSGSLIIYGAAFNIAEEAT